MSVTIKEKTMKGFNMKRLVSFVLAVALCISFAGCQKEGDSSENIQVPILDTTVENLNTSTAEVGTITKSYTLQGDFSYPYSTNVLVKKGGVIKNSYLDADKQIEKGDLLLEFECDEFDEQIEAQKEKIEVAKENLESLKNSGASQAKIDVAQVDLELEENALNKLNAQLDEYKVYATMSGYLEVNGVEKDYAKGNTLYDGYYCGKIIDRSTKELTGSFYGDINDRLDGVEYGTKAVIRQGNVAESTGIVKDIIFHENGDFSSYEYVISIDENESDFYDFGTIDIVLKVYEKENVVIVPQDSIVNVGKRTFVYTVVDGIRIETDVELGITDEITGMIEITSGLSGGETIVI